MTSSERIGTAINSKNLRSDELHMDVDVIAALARASNLGASLHHLRSGGQLGEFGAASQATERVLVKACRRKRMGISRDASKKCSAQALYEWMINVCKLCNGTGSKLLNYSVLEVGEKVESGDCPHCQGSGIFMPIWSWRKKSLGLKGDVSEGWWEKRIELAKEIIEDAYRSANRRVGSQLREPDPEYQSQ